MLPSIPSPLFCILSPGVFWFFEEGRNLHFSYRLSPGETLITQRLGKNQANYWNIWKRCALKNGRDPSRKISEIFILKSKSRETHLLDLLVSIGMFCKCHNFGSLVLCWSTSTNKKHKIIFKNIILGNQGISNLEHVGRCVFRFSNLEFTMWDFWNFETVRNFEILNLWNHIAT